MNKLNENMKKQLKSKPNKTPEDKEAYDKARNKMEKALKKMRRSEEHSRREKGQQGKRGGNKK